MRVGDILYKQTLKQTAVSTSSHSSISITNHWNSPNFLVTIMSTKSVDTAPVSEGDEGVTLSQMKSAFQTEINDNGKKRSMWAVSMETWGMMGGKEGEGDLMLETVEEGVPILKKYIKEKDLKLAEEQATAKEKLPFNSWMDLVPLEEFHVSQTTFLKSFLKWSMKDQEDIVEGSEGANLVVNASKARRRLDSYFDWMKENMAESIAKAPLTLDSVIHVQKLWELQSSYDKEGRYCWWFDIGKMDQKGIKECDPMDQLRYIVWYSHLVMFDLNAQDKGVILMEDLDKIGFWNTMTLIPMELSAKMDRLTIGVLPVKMKGIYMLGCARWIHLMMALMKPFLSKKMRSRLIVINETDDRQEFMDGIFERDNVPDGFCKLQGEMPPNASIEKFKKRAKKKEKKAAKKEKEKGKE